jgi:hypothetical protein
MKDTLLKPETPDQLKDESGSRAPICSPFVDVTDSERARDGSQELRYVRTVTDNLWISALYRLTGFGYYEWETAICTREPQTCNIVRGDRRDELERLTPSEIAEWLDEHGHEKNSMETVLGILSENPQARASEPSEDCAERPVRN